MTVGGGATCLVEGEASHAVTVPASGFVTVDYACSFTSQPNYSGLNTASASWNDAFYHTPSGIATGTAAVNFTTPTTIVDGSVSVVDDKTDPFNPVTLGSATYTDPSPKDFKYAPTKTGVSGVCTDYTNTATFTTNTSSTTGSDSQKVTVCSSLVKLKKLTGIGSVAPHVDPTMGSDDEPQSARRSDDAAS